MRKKHSLCILWATLASIAIVASASCNKNGDNSGNGNGAGGKETVEGVLPGEFSVAQGATVHFAKGNLMARLTADGSPELFLADTQYECVGDAGGNVSPSENKTLDLFGWVGSSAPKAARKSYGALASDSAEDYGAKTDDECPAWGKAVGDGWRALSETEWNYLFKERKDAAAKHGLCSIVTESGNVSGLLLLPDSWTVPEPFVFDPDAGAFSDNAFTASVWEECEKAGAVFLPAGGYRFTDEVREAGTKGYYWTSTPYSKGSIACNVSFEEGIPPSGNNNNRYFGMSVRLVR